MNCNISGKLGEAFCKEYLNAEEPHFEIKSTSRKSNIVILKIWQLLNDLHKQFLICVYDRATRRLKRGPRKGKEIHTESIEKAYEKRVHIYAIKGFDLLEIVVQKKLPTFIVRSEKETFNWKAYYRLPLKSLPDRVVQETERYVLHGEVLDHTSDYDDEVPF